MKFEIGYDEKDKKFIFNMLKQNKCRLCGNHSDTAEENVSERRHYQMQRKRKKTVLWEKLNITIRRNLRVA